jgi:transposase
MIDPDVRVKIRHYFFAEHWKIGTIAAELQVHPDTVRRAIEVEKFQNATPLRASLLDPYLPFLRETLEAHPRLRVTRLHRMLADRGYTGSIRQLRRSVVPLRPRPQEAFLRTQVFAGEEAQVDWAHFGAVMVGRARRTLSCFVMTLSWSRALYLEFFFDQSMESFLRGHVHAFAWFQGSARVLLYDNLKSAVLDRHGSQVHFNPRLLELAGHYHFIPRPCQVRAGNQKDQASYCTSLDVFDTSWG